MLSKKYTNKKEYYFSFLNFNKLYLSEVKFTKLPIESLVKRCGDNVFTFRLKTSFEGKMCEYDFLNQNDNDFYCNYFNNLGMSDSITQENFANNSMEFIKNCLDDAIENEKKYKSLYIKLGFLFGLIIFVIIL